MGLRDKLARKIRSWATNQADHALFQNPKAYFALKLALLAGITIQRIIILTDPKYQDQFTFDLVQLIGLPFLFAFECLLFVWVKKVNRLKQVTDLLFGGLQIVILEFIISLSVPFFMNTNNSLTFILQQEILFICLHTIIFFNSFPLKSGLLLYTCITFIFRLAPPITESFYAGWSVMALAVIASFFVVFFSKDKPELSQSQKYAEDFSKLEAIPHGLAILTRDKEVIFMNGVFKGILSLTDERDALHKIMKMKRFESYPEETKQLLLKEIKVRMNNDIKSRTFDDEKMDINNFPTAMSLGKRRMTTDAPAIYIKKPYSPPPSKHGEVLAGQTDHTENSKFIMKNDIEQGKGRLEKLSHLSSIQVHIETERDDQNTVEFSINTVISSLIDESPYRVKRKISLAQVTKNIVNGLFIRRASKHFKNKDYNNNNNIFDLTNNKSQKVQAVNRNPKGELRILEITLTPMISGQKEALFIYLNDITSEMKAKELHETSQYKDKLLKFVSHEFRTPLNCLVMSLNTLKPLVSKEIYINYLAPALNSTLMLLSLVNDILDYSQMQARKLKIVIAPSNLRNLLNEVVTMMEMQAQARNLQLKLDWDSRISKAFFTDGNRLKQIVVNLVSNALKFTIEGSITIKATHISKSMCKIEVSDTGVGISKENLENLFKEFGKIQENIHMNPQGVGLGLVISKLLSQELGSDRVGLQVKSEVGVGTSFYFFLISKRQEEAGFEHTDLDSSEDDQEPRIYTPKLSEPHSRHLALQKKSASVKNLKPQQYSKSKTSNVRRVLTPKKFLADNPQPYTLNFKHVYAKNSILSMTPIVAPQEQGEYNFKTRKQDAQRRQRCLSTGFSPNPQDVKDYSEQLTTIFIKLNRTCKCPKILLVDDNAFNLTALKMLLKSFGIESVGVVSGEAAIDGVLENEGHSHFCKNFAMIFMDVEMPGLSGFETAKELRRLMNNKEIAYTPIVGITGHNPQEKRVECLMSGMNDMVCKPVTAQKMKEILCRWIIPE